MRNFIAFFGCLGIFAVVSLPLEACSSRLQTVGGADDGGPRPGEEGGLEASAPPDSGPAETEPPADAGTDGSFVEAKHAPFPQVVYQGGGILTAPQLVTVTFPGDPLASSFNDFGQTVESSSWWSSVTSGYCESGGKPCVGVGSAATSVAFPTAPASSYTDSDEGGSSSFQAWLTGAIASGDLPPPQAGAISNTLYLVYFPTSTTITYDGSTSCQEFDGYHGSATYNGQQVPYAVIPECSGESAGETPPITTLENTTITASHELLEASTDPSNFAIGYALDFEDEQNFGWLDVEGFEAADLCVDPFLLAQDEWPENSFIVQRIWSNAQAKAGLDPCAPIPTSEVYFSGAPTQSFFVMDVGSTLTFEVDAFSTGRRADWTMAAQDWSGASTAYLNFTIEGGTENSTLGSILSVNNGTKVQVKMTLTQDPGDLPTGEADGAIVSVGDISKPTTAHFWPFAVMSPADAEDAGLDASLSAGRRHVKPRR
jgi:hypothetical protein